MTRISHPSVSVTDSPSSRACAHRSLASPHGRDLIFHLVRSQALVDGVHDLIALETTSPAVEAGDEHLLCAAQVRGPLQAKHVICVLARWSAIPLT